MIAASFGHVEVVRVLLGIGNANVNRKHAYAGTTALHFAAEMGQVEVIKLLCQHGANVRSKKSTGGIPLHTAADANQTDAVRVLLSPICEGGADTVNFLLMGDTTPMYFASQRGFAEVVEVCIVIKFLRATNNGPNTMEKVKGL